MFPALKEASKMISLPGVMYSAARRGESDGCKVGHGSPSGHLVQKHHKFLRN